MKNIKLIVVVTLLMGSVFTGFSQTGVDSLNNNYKEGINQNPTMNDNQNINISNPSPDYDMNSDRTSPGLNSSSEFKLNKEDSVTMFKKGGSIIDTDTISTFPIRSP